jgi:acetyl esterase/lipase
VFIALVFLAIGGLMVAVNATPRPMAWFTNRLFARNAAAAQITPPGFNELSRKVLVEKDIEYPSKLPRNRLDVFSPRNASVPVPTVFWIHGGGFVGGDKADVETWATMIAANGYTVVSINYALAPDHNYQSPLIQTGEAYDFVISNPQRFPTVDGQRLVFGGSSAGAQIASQFMAMQTNPTLAASMQTEPLVPKGDLIGGVLYCGPYDLTGLSDTGSWFGKFFVWQMGWAYFGFRDWKTTPQAAQARTVDHVTPDYPPVFITDGNTGSFEADARNLEARLRENGVHVDSLFHPLENGSLGHEYQFDFSKPEAMECFYRTLAFLERVSTDVGRIKSNSKMARQIPSDSVGGSR